MGASHFHAADAAAVAATAYPIAKNMTAERPYLSDREIILAHYERWRRFAAALGHSMSNPTTWCKRPSPER